MKKRIVCLLLALLMAFSVVGVLASCGDCEHVDANKDGKCDECGEDVGGGQPSGCTEHVDANKDGKCDECGTKMTTSCKHEDENGDEKCDKCGADLGDGEEEEVINYPWDSAELLFQYTENTNNDELPAGCRRYLAGEDSTVTDDIDDMVSLRNADAEYLTKITVTYQYYPNTEDYGWGSNIDRIETTVKSASTKATPDVYCNFVYDMVGASVKGCFANLRSTSRGSGDLKGLNYFSFLDADYDETVDNEGYMYEYMTSLTLSKHKMYVLASDYFTDMIRAFFIIPVSVDLIESTGAAVTGNEDYNLDDFYKIVTDGEWTYETLALYADKAHVDDGSGDTADQWLGDEVVGFAMADGGLATSGLIYTTSVEIIKKTWSDDKNDWVYEYPSTSETDLDEFCDKTSWLFTQPGIVLVRKARTPGMTEWGQSSLLAIRTRFTQGHVLFGDIMLVGALEFPQYQEMKDKGGFGVVPVPLYRTEDPETGEKDRYLTQIHNVGRPGAIAANTLKFVECTAFLNYQSTHSTDILNEYYDYKLQYDVVDGTQTGTVEMLKYIRLNVRTSFDKAFEDAIGVFYGDEAEDNKWAKIISKKDFILDIRQDYDTLVGSKQKNLENLEKYYEELPE